jgi:HEAT repeat protein
MTKKPHMLQAVLALGVVGVLVWLVMRRTGEPVYREKRLSEWLRGYDYAGLKSRARAESDEAVRKMGTNAIPLLLQRLRENESSLKFRVFRLLEKQHFLIITNSRASTRNVEAGQAFRALGAAAGTAVPELIRIYNRNISVDSQCAVAISLGCIGPAASNAVPALLARASNRQTEIGTNELVCDSAIFALGHIHAQPARVVPVLMEQLLHAPKANTQYAATVALGWFGADAKPAVPVLIKCYADVGNSAAMKAAVRTAIQKIDTGAAAKAGVH